MPAVAILYFKSSLDPNRYGNNRKEVTISCDKNVQKISLDIYLEGSRQDRMQFAKFSLHLDENLKAGIFNFT